MLDMRLGHSSNRLVFSQKTLTESRAHQLRLQLSRLVLYCPFDANHIRICRMQPNLFSSTTLFSRSQIYLAAFYLVVRGRSVQL